MSHLLDNIIKENDIKNIDPADYKKLAKEIRRLLVKSVSHTGGHLASNLGAVELTMALHLTLDFPYDKLVWDVGHQSYVHKILTGRSDAMWSLRQTGGISGFPSVRENLSDTFDTGHSSTSVSVALGLAKARDLKGTDEKVFAVIGDGALSGGMAYEAMNNAAKLGTNIVIVLNDNKMSIAPGVGGMSDYLGDIRADKRYRKLKDQVEKALDAIPNVGTPLAGYIRRAKDSIKHLLIPGMLFEDMGLIYLGPIDGHDIKAMKKAFETASKIEDEPVLVHVLTKKGKGYEPAEKQPDIFHGVGTFDYMTGVPDAHDELTYTKVFGEWMVANGKEHKELVSVCAAMPDGCGLHDFSKTYPDRFFDVGIAEEHAVTFAAGLAAGGLRPVVSIYSTFLQRAYDQIIHDVCIGDKDVIFAIDRSGIVGNDGKTHQGIFDISYLTSMPNMTVISPMDGKELINALNYSLYEHKGPIAIRYPKGAISYSLRSQYKDCVISGMSDYDYGRADILSKGKDVLFLAVGDMVNVALDTSKKLSVKGVSSTVVNMRFVKPFDKELILSQAKKHRLVVTMEDGILSGGFSEHVKSVLYTDTKKRVEVISVGISDTFIEHGDIEDLFKKYGMDADSVARDVSDKLKYKGKDIHG